MILYFSGTGNSKHVAELLELLTKDEIVSLNDIIRNRKVPVFESKTPYIFVCPTYAWRIPRVVADTIKKAQFQGNKDVYFIVTCGESSGNASGYAKKLAKEKKLVFKGLKAVIMPENYVAMFDVKEKAKTGDLIKKADSDVVEIARSILNHENLKEPLSFKGKLLSCFVNPLFYATKVKANGFYTTDKCIACGKCAARCPMGNITIKNKKPVWGNKCTHCMACISYCLDSAIEYKNKTQGKPRYHM